MIGDGLNASQALLDASHTTPTLSAPAPSQFNDAALFITGIEHIFLGYDHIAFLVAVVLCVGAAACSSDKDRHRIYNCSFDYTRFAALNIVVIPSIVEPAIAASIVFVAMENFFFARY